MSAEGMYSIMSHLPGVPGFCDCERCCHDKVMWLWVQRTQTLGKPTPVWRLTHPRLDDGIESRGRLASWPVARHVVVNDPAVGVWEAVGEMAALSPPRLA
ncbi:hypothetical protein CIHG_00548 [Coccidioides immitis H538.4]|uniref:Uncharacterized protein n=1 Tax=Coccidioides immitis H538.4 TaxID=396776 RepID=A0A0J8RDX1_COCIT|nr:hypothetical protein CIHG_00548 [Coccidioides immitis H538.4]